MKRSRSREDIIKRMIQIFIRKRTTKLSFDVIESELLDCITVKELVGILQREPYFQCLGKIHSSQGSIWRIVNIPTNLYNEVRIKTGHGCEIGKKCAECEKEIESLVIS